MALRFLVDHCVSNYTVQTLREAQHEVFRSWLKPIASAFASGGSTRAGGYSGEGER